MPAPIQFSDADCRDAVIVADTCLLLNFLGYDSYSSEDEKKLHEECENFIWDSQMSHGTIAYTHLISEEMYNVFLRGRLYSLLGHDIDELSLKEIAYQYEPEYITAADYAIDEVKKAMYRLNQLNFVFNEPLCMNPITMDARVMELQSKYHMPGLTDLKHFAIADNEGAKYFATIDKDFKKINDENITVVTYSRFINT